WVVRNHTLAGTKGYVRIGHIRLYTAGQRVYDLGRIPTSPEGADVEPEVPPAPEGRVTVTGWVQVGEEGLDRDLPAGQVASINLGDVGEELDESPLGGWVTLQSEDPEVERPEPLGEPDTDTGPHMAYAIQWWIVIPAVLVFWGMALRREAQTGGPRPPREKKVRIWDEEDG